MADAEGAGGDRTEAPTGRRLQHAREAGQSAVSPELSVVAVLAGSTIVMAMAVPAATVQFVHRLAPFFTRFDMPPGTAVRLAALATLHMTLPFVAVALAAGAGAVLLQTGFLLSFAPLRPDLHRISPAAGLRRLLSPQSLMDAAKSIVKVAVTAAVLWHVLSADLPQLMGAPSRDLRTLPATTLGLALHVMLAVLLI